MRSGGNRASILRPFGSLRPISIQSKDVELVEELEFEHGEMDLNYILMLLSAIIYFSVKTYKVSHIFKYVPDKFINVIQTKRIDSLNY